MVASGTEIYDPQSGQRTIFRKTSAETGGAEVVMESFHRPHAPNDGMHVHPYQHSSFEMVSGRLHVQVRDKVTVIGPGDRVDIPPNVPHCFWSEDDEEAREIQVFRPGLNIDDFFATYFTLIQAGYMSDDGMPKSLLLLGVLMQDYDRVIRVMEPARWMQVLVMRVLGPIGRLMGYGKLIKRVVGAHPPAMAPTTR